MAKARSDEDPLWWVIASAGVPILSAFGAAQFWGAAVREPEGTWKAWLFILGACATLIAVVVAVIAKVRDVGRSRKTKSAVEAQRVALKDALLPVASTIADMALQPHQERGPLLKSVSSAAAAALSSTVGSEAKQTRAVIYMLDVDHEPTRMTSVGFAGRGQRPRPFVAGTARGDGAMDFLNERVPAFYPDLSDEQPDGYQGTASGYSTFISVPIWTENGVYGMVTLDALKAGSLNEGHLALVELVAEMMTIPFEVSQDDDVPLTSSDDLSADFWDEI